MPRRSAPRCRRAAYLLASQTLVVPLRRCDAGAALSAADARALLLCKGCSIKLGAEPPGKCARARRGQPRCRLIPALLASQRVLLQAAAVHNRTDIAAFVQEHPPEVEDGAFEPDPALAEAYRDGARRHDQLGAQLFAQQ